MSNTSTSPSEASSLSGYTRKLGFPKSHIHVNLDNHFSSKVYTSGQPVSGNVTITTQRDVRFDSIQIVLMGTTRTRVDIVGTPAESTHIFLKLPMPIPESTYPVPRVLEAGRTLTVPFNFVVPHYLTIGACNHHVTSALVHDQHVRLPPTLGFWERDDLAPEMAKVEYAVKARVFREPELGGKTVKIMEASQQIRVLPASPEDPPLSVTKHDREYTLSKSKTLRRSLLSGRLGRLTATAAQPEAAVLRPDGIGISATSARVALRFEPASAGDAACPPPRLTSVSAKLTARTYYSLGPIPGFPNLGDWDRHYASDRKGAYSTSISLFSQPIDSHIRWTSGPQVVRRDSGYSSDAATAEEREREGASDDTDGDERSRRQQQQQQRKNKTKKGKSSSSSSSSQTPVVYESTLQIPIRLPSARKIFVPSFHSCIASRAYSLQLALSFSAAGGATGSGSTLNLSVPLQVIVGGGGGGGADYEGLAPMTTADLQAYTFGGGAGAGAGGGEDMMLADGLLPPSFEAALEEAEADAHLRPRLLSVPDARFRETSVLPGYGELAAR